MGRGKITANQINKSSQLFLCVQKSFSPPGIEGKKKKEQESNHKENKKKNLEKANKKLKKIGPR